MIESGCRWTWVYDDWLQIAAILEEAWAPEYTYIGIIVDVKTVQDLQVGRYVNTLCVVSDSLCTARDDA